jgi:hypothetical protein
MAVFTASLTALASSCRAIRSAAPYASKSRVLSRRWNNSSLAACNSSMAAESSSTASMCLEVLDGSELSRIEPQSCKIFPREF